MKKFLIALCLLIATSFTEVKSQGCLTADMMIMVDWSGSECGNEQKLTTAAALFVSELEISDYQLRVGVLTFSDEPLELVKLTGNKDSLLYEISKMSLGSAYGGTQINESLEVVANELVNDRPVRKIIIIISDGEIDDIEEATITTNLLRNSLQLTIFAVNIGSSMDLIYGTNNLIDLAGNPANVEISTSVGLVQALKRLSLCN